MKEFQQLTAAASYLALNIWSRNQGKGIYGSSLRYEREYDAQDVHLS